MSAQPTPPDDLETTPGRAVLAPATRLLWRANDTVHLELGDRAVVVSGLSATQAARLARSLDPHPPTPRTTAAGPPLRAVAVAGTGGVVAALLGEGFLWPSAGRSSTGARAGRRVGSGTSRSGAPSPEPAGDPRRHPPVPRLAGELAALTLRYGERAAEVLAERARRRVSVRGHARLAVQVGALLAASGVGRIELRPSGRSVALRDAAPGGVRQQDEGRDIVLAARDAIRRAAPETETTPLPPGDVADLTVLVLDAPVDDDQRESLHAAGAAHLALELAPGRGVVGPLVLPGLTSCLGCADLHRQDRDPAWPALAAQLGVPLRHAPAAEVAAGAVLAGLACAQALAYLDGEAPATLDGTLEIQPPDWRVRRRSWPVHPRCLCVGPAAGDNGGHNEGVGGSRT